MATTKLDPALAQFRIAHLNALQAIITRIAGYQATVKNLSVTAETAIIALTYQQHAPELSRLALAVIPLLMLIDAFYLCSERGFRAEYNAVVARSLDQAADMKILSPKTTIGGFFKCLGSLPLILLYGCQILAALLVILYAPQYVRQQSKSPIVLNVGFENPHVEQSVHAVQQQPKLALGTGAGVGKRAGTQ